MEIMVTLPEDPAEREAYFARVSQLHAEAIREILGAQTWPTAQKTERLQYLIQELKGKTRDPAGQS